MYSVIRNGVSEKEEGLRKSKGFTIFYGHEVSIQYDKKRGNMEDDGRKRN